jgi:AAA domain
MSATGENSSALDSVFDLPDLADKLLLPLTAALADIITQAAASGAKVILAGDTQQLQAVENGGGMSLLADALGYARLAEPVRFRNTWEQHASLRLRDGDTTVLAEYDQHGRIIGGEPEQMMDAAAAAYLALTLDGTDTLLMAADHALRRELSRRIRDDLIQPGIVSRGPTVTIADGTRASPGDLIICTRNDHSVEAGEPDRTLANGDLLRIEAVTPKGLLVRRALDADPRTGQRRWTDRPFLYAHYADAELGYAVTDHAAQGRTVHAGLAVITGTEDRQHAYVALTRGTDVNTAYVFTTFPKRADPAPGPRPAPELARYDQIYTERTGPPAPATPPAPPLAALGPADGPDVRGMPDGQLLHLRDTYPIETAWAPRYVGDELRQVRASWDARLAGLRRRRRPRRPAAGRRRPGSPEATTCRQLPGPAGCLPVFRGRRPRVGVPHLDEDPRVIA